MSGKVIPRSYTECKKFLGEDSCKKISKTLGIYKYTEGSGEIWYGLRYHKTIIVRFYEDGDVELSNGGYLTKSTKDKINKVIRKKSSREFGGNIFQKRFYWYIEEQFPDNMNRTVPAILFSNGFIFYIGDLDETTGYRLRNPSK